LGGNRNLRDQIGETWLLRKTRKSAYRGGEKGISPDLTTCYSLKGKWPREKGERGIARQSQVEMGEFGGMGGPIGRGEVLERRGKKESRGNGDMLVTGKKD